MKFKFILLVMVIFFAGCSTSYKREGFTSTFERSLNTKSHGYNVIKDPTGSAPTELVERFEVRAGDCSRDSVWSDCENARERSEIASERMTFIGKEEKYSWYMYVPTDWKDVVPAKNIHGQIFQVNKLNPNTYGAPLIAIILTNRGLQVENFLKYKESNIYDIDKVKGKWTKIEIHAKWLMEVDGVMPDGFYKVYINDELLYEYKGNTVSSYGIDEIRFKYGIYRARLNLLGGSTPPTQIVYYANVKRERLK
jgi:hypothetical protein